MTYVAHNCLHAVLVRAMIQLNTCTGRAPHSACPNIGSAASSRSACADCLSGAIVACFQLECMRCLDQRCKCCTIQVAGMHASAGLQERHNQEQTGNQQQPDNTQAGRFPSILHYDESAADGAGILQNYSRSGCAHIHEMRCFI